MVPWTRVVIVKAAGFRSVLKIKSKEFFDGLDVMREKETLKLTLRLSAWAVGLRRCCTLRRRLWEAGLCRRGQEFGFGHSVFWVVY